jgi:hypothetical protein
MCELIQGRKEGRKKIYNQKYFSPAASSRGEELGEISSLMISCVVGVRV